jgi:hypothetical protein
MPTSHLNHLLQGIQQLDVDGFENLLDDKADYGTVGKEAFLRYLKQLFDSFREKGDTELMSYPGACRSRGCEYCNCEGYTFVGNRSKAHISLIFLGNSAPSMKFCSGFVCHDTEVQLGQELYNFTDLMKCREPDFDTALKIEYCKAAVRELKEDAPEYIDPTIFLPWLEKYERLNALLPPLYSTHDEIITFTHIYHFLDELRGYLVHTQRVEEALARWKQLDPENERALLSWLVAYEHENRGLLLFDFYVYDAPDGSHRFMVRDGVKVDYKAFEILQEFIDLNDPIYWRKFEEYDNRPDAQKYLAASSTWLSDLLVAQGISFDT